jgi:hypothetical protein
VIREMLGRVPVAVLCRAAGFLNAARQPLRISLHEVLEGIGPPGRWLIISAASACRWETSCGQLQRMEGKPLWLESW